MSRLVFRRARAHPLGLLAALLVVGAAQPRAETAGASPLSLDEVLESVERHYPLVLAAEREREIAAGALMSARGAFDVKLALDGITAPRGYYQNDRLDLSLAQPLRPLGAEIKGGYRIGRGDFAEYDKDLLTNRDGELRLGARVPLLRDRAIDARRADVRRAEIGVDRAEPLVMEQRIEAGRLAVLAYWEWLAAGEKDRIAQNLVRLAETRQVALESAVEEGLIAEIVLVDNERLIAERRALRIDTERRLQQAAIDLSLYLRDDEGMPLIPDAALLPGGFPPLFAPEVDLQADVERAWVIRPELQRLQLEREAKSIEIAKTRNELLPGVDLAFGASQDYGEAVDTPDDKGPLEVKAGLVIDLPIQRRGARGELRSKRGELARLEQRLRYARDRIGVDVRDAHSAWVQAYRRFEQAVRSVELARELEEAERLQLSEGNSDLLRLNIREQQTAQAASFVVDVMTEYFEARSNYRAAIGELPTS
jgi:outer membrane protein TolC